MALKWTKTSLEPSLGEMKPKPLVSLNHLTCPLIFSDILKSVEKDKWCEVDEGRLRRSVLCPASLARQAAGQEEEEGIGVLHDWSGEAGVVLQRSEILPK